MPAFEWCLSQHKNVPASHAIIGDSKAEAMYYGLARESASNQNWLLMGTLPAYALDSARSPNLTEQTLSRLEADPAIKVVVLANALRSIFVANKDTGLIDKQYSATEIATMVSKQNAVIMRLQAAGKRVVFLMDNPTLPEPTNCVKGAMTNLPLLSSLLTRSINPLCRISYSDYLAGTAAYQNFVAELKKMNPALVVFDPIPLLCDTPNNVCTYFEGKNFLYGYGDHLSDYANSKIAKQLLLVVVP
jgi:hypothetical protein